MTGAGPWRVIVADHANVATVHTIEDSYYCYKIGYLEE